ncbi:MAG: flagellar hook-length control protein FliK [Rubrivivax sp.]|nr:flagellar hook-length control protein FliK [Rubrivivax sp.]
MLASTLPPVLTPHASAPAPSAPAGNGGGNGSESFARMLDAADARRQAQAQATANKAAGARSAEKTAADRKDGAAPSAEGAGSRASQAGDEADPADAAATAGDAAIEQPLHSDTAAASDAAALLAGLSGLPRPTATDAQAAVAGGARAGLRGASEAADETGTEATPGADADGLDSAGKAQRRAGAAALSSSGADAGQARDNFAQLMRQARTEAGGAGRAGEAGALRLQAAATHAVDAQLASVESLAPGAALLTTAAITGATPGGVAVAAAGHARLTASPGSPAFAGQLGAQLTIFVREGVQHARLELHPLELGPVTVQIAIDGSQARVNLAAEHAATRQALEQAMPTLAGSLRDAGLTLSGGGVFEQPRQPQPDAGTATSEGKGGRDGSTGRGEHAGGGGDGGPAVLAGAPLRRRGVVDLVA